MNQNGVKQEEIYLCTLIHFFCYPPTAGSNGVVFSSERCKRGIAVFLLKELKNVHRLVYPTLNELCLQLLHQLGEIGQQLVHELHTVFVGLATPDDMSRLFQAFETLIIGKGTASGAGVLPGSPLGLFLRRCTTSFRLMPYEAMAKLHASIQSSLAALTHAPPGGTHLGPLMSRLRLNTSVDGVLDNSMRTMYRHKQVLKAPAHHPRTGGGIEACRGMPAEQQVLSGGMVAEQPPLSGGTSAEQQVLLLLEDLVAMGMPQGIRLQLAIALASKDYAAAIDAFHRHSDFAQASAGEEEDSSGGPPTGGAKGRYQSSLIGLSNLHAAFGHTQEALNALGEAMSVAHQQGDQLCLARCLESLQKILVDCPGAPGLPALGIGSSAEYGHWGDLRALLLRCLKQGHVLSNPLLTVVARLGQARCSLQQSSKLSPDSTSPAASNAVIASLALRDVVMLCHAAGLNAAAGAAAPTPASAPNANSLMGLFNEPSVLAMRGGVSESGTCSAMHQISGSAHLLQSHAWVSCGSPALAHMHALSFMACYGGHMEENDLASALMLGIIKDKQGLIRALSLPCMGQSHPAAASGSHESFTHSEYQEDSKPLAVAKLSLALLDTLSSSDNVHRAHLLVQEMSELVSKDPYAEQPLRAEVLRSQAMVQLSAGHLAGSYDSALELFNMATSTGLQAEAIQALLLLSDILMEAQDPSCALSYVSSALLHASTSHHDVLAIATMASLMKCWLCLCPAASWESKQLHKEMLPIVLTAAGYKIRHSLTTMLLPH